MTTRILACLIVLAVILAPVAPIYAASGQPAPFAQAEPVARPGLQTVSAAPNAADAEIAAVLAEATQVAAGFRHTCALTATGGVKCWGLNTSGQLGDGTTADYRTAPADVSGLTSGVTAIAAGDRHTCALTTAGVKCWGRNTEGQLGNNATTNSATPVAVSGLDAAAGVTAIAAGLNHTCAITAAGVKCWGDNSYGQIGDGTKISPRKTPVDVSGLAAGVTAITAGTYHTCAPHRGRRQVLGLERLGPVGHEYGVDAGGCGGVWGRVERHLPADPIEVVRP